MAKSNKRNWKQRKKITTNDFHNYEQKNANLWKIRNRGRFYYRNTRNTEKRKWKNMKID